MVAKRIGLLAVLLASPAFAQQAEPELKQLEIQSLNKGYAVILGPDGHEHYCEARVTDEAVDLGPCKPLRLVTPLINKKPAAPTASRTPSAEEHTRAQVIGLFENNGCSLKYSELQAVLGKLGARQRETVGTTVAAMSKSGEIADDQRNERVTLKAAGSRCR